MKISVAIPTSSLQDESLKIDKTRKISVLARACAIFQIDTIYVYQEGNNGSDGNFISMILKYLETPQFLRRRLFQKVNDLKFAGVLQPLKIPSHNTPTNAKKIVATGFGRLGSMVQYQDQKSIPDIVAYGKMLTGGYLTMAATLANKKIYDSFSGEFDDWKHLFHGHTYTGNPIAAAVANENLQMYKKYNLIKQVQKTSKIFEKYSQEILDIDIVGDVRHKGMLMGIELVSNKKKKTPIRTKKSINKVFFEEGKKQGIYLRTLGNIVMLVPPLSIQQNELELLLKKTINTIQVAKSKTFWLLTSKIIEVNNYHIFINGMKDVPIWITWNS